MKSIEELKGKIKASTEGREMRHTGAWEAAPKILNSVGIDDIGKFE